MKVVLPNANLINIIKYILIPIFTTLLALVLWEFLKFFFNKLSFPLVDVYFLDKGIKKFEFKVPTSGGFNLPIYIIARRKFPNWPIINPIMTKEWRVLVNMVTSSALNIYSLSLFPSGKYSAGEYILYEGSPTCLGPDAFGTAAKINSGNKLPIEIVVQVYYGRRGKPIFVKKLLLIN